MSTSLTTPSTLPADGQTTLPKAAPRWLLSRSMEKTFQRMTTRPSARHAYVNAEIATALATQIRNLRTARGWTQRELARRMGTTQNAVSRLEDPSYGRISMQTLLLLSKVFDTGLQVRFISMVQMLRDTWQPRPGADVVPPFEDEAPGVAFVASGRHAYVVNQATSHTVAAVSAPTGGLSFHATARMVRVATLGGASSDNVRVLQPSAAQRQAVAACG